MTRAARLLILGLAATSCTVRVAPSLERVGYPETTNETAAALRAMNEPRLIPEQDTNNEAYRVLFYSGSNVISVRIERAGQRLVLIGKRLALNPLDNLPKKVEKTRRVPLSPAQWDLFTHQIARAGFWTMVSEEPLKYNDEGRLLVGLDGSTFVLEGASGGRRHVVLRWWHEDYPDFERACHCLVIWSGVLKPVQPISPETRRTIQECTPGG